MKKLAFLFLSFIITSCCKEISCSKLSDVRENISLTNDWRFVVDSLGIGEKDSWFSNFPFEKSSTVNIPHTWNVQKGLEDYAGICWYYKKIKVQLDNEKKYYLRFEAVYRDANIYINGEKIYDNYDSGFLPFTIDITDKLKESDNILVVSVSNKYSSTALPYMKSFDWANDGGIIRPVSLIITNGNLIDYANFSTKINGNTAFSFSLREPLYRNSIINIKLKNEKDSIVFDNNYDILSGSNLHVDSFNIEKPHLWHFDNPYLYSVEVRLITDSKVIDNYYTKIGYREVKLEGDKLLLNGESIRVSGIEWMPGSNPKYGMAEPNEYIDSVLNDMKDINCVITRFHWQQSDYVLSKMDEMGFLVQEEIPWWQAPYDYNDSLYSTHKLQIRGMIENHYNHPCIISWGLGNELWGDNRVKTIFSKMKKFASDLDSTRLITFVSNSISYGPQKDISVLSDILTWNEYIGTWHGKSRAELSGYIRQIRQELPNRALLITEHGLCEPKFSGGDIRRKDEMIYHFNEWEKHPWIVGAIYFSLNDYRTHVGEEGTGKFKCRVHGVCDLFRNRKPSFNIYKDLSSPIVCKEEIVNGKHYLNIKCKHSLPSYSLRDYNLLLLCKSDTISYSIPYMHPGDSIKIELNPEYQGYKVIRPNNYVCFEKYKIE